MRPTSWKPRVTLLGILAPAAALAAAVVPAAAHPVAKHRAAATGLVPVRARPGVGGPRTVFTVSYRRRAQTGLDGGVRRRDSLLVRGPRRAGCVSSAGMGAPMGPAGAMVHMRLVPARLGGHWCTGTFRGVIEESLSVVCRPGPARACPMLVIAPQTIGRFRFRVR